MNDVTEKVFKALGIKPNEKFKIKEDNSGDSYYLDENLSGYCVESDNSLLPFNADFLQDILRGKIEIVKLPKEPTKEDKIIIDYARLFGYNWIAVDGDGEIIVSEYELQRSGGKTHWTPKGTFKNFDYLGGKLSFLSWEDEPYYIGKKGE